MRSFSVKASLLALSLPAALLVAGCSGNGSTSNNPQAQTAPAFVVGTDAPLPSVVSFAVQVQSIDATTSSGASVSLLSGSPTIDFARFDGLQTLLDMNDVPVGTYTGVTVTLGSATIGYLNTSVGSAPTIYTEPATLTTSTITKTLANPLVVSTAGPVGLHLDFDLRQSIQVSGGQITGNVTPTFDVSVVTPSSPGAYLDEFDAAVVSVNTSAQTFVVQGPHGRNFTVNVNGQTDWDNGESINDLTSNSIVQLSGTLDRADLTLDADDIAIVSQNGFYAGGLVTDVTPSSGVATSFDLYVRGLLPATTGISLGSIAQVDLSGSEHFFIHRMHDPLTQFLFNSSSLVPGQHILVGGPASGATNPQDVTVNRVSLHQWGYVGTVVPSSVSSADGTFQMQVAGFAGVLIPQTVTVYTDSNTTFRDSLTALDSLQDNANVRAVGLLILDPTSGNTILLARYVDGLN